MCNNHQPSPIRVDEGDNIVKNITIDNLVVNMICPVVWILGFCAIAGIPQILAKIIAGDTVPIDLIVVSILFLLGAIVTDVGLAYNDGRHQDG